MRFQINRIQRSRHTIIFHQSHTIFHMLTILALTLQRIFSSWMNSLLYWALCTSLQMLPLTSGTRIFIITNIHNEIKWTYDLVLTAQAHHPSWLSNRWLLKLPRSAGPDISLRIMEILITNIAFDTTCLSIHKTLTVSLKNQWEVVCLKSFLSEKSTDLR